MIVPNPDEWLIHQVFPDECHIHQGIGIARADEMRKIGGGVSSGDGVRASLTESLAVFAEQRPTDGLVAEIRMGWGLR